MTNGEYLETQTELLELARRISTLDLDGFLSRIESSHSFGPMIDPTLYREGAPLLRAIQGVALAARGVQVALREVNRVRQDVREVIAP